MDCGIKKCLLVHIHAYTDKPIEVKKKQFYLSQHCPWPRIRDKPFAYELSIFHYVVSSEMFQEVSQLLSRFKLRH